MRLKDKAIIVTGSTTGVGQALARRFVAEGARVLVHGLEKDLGQAVVADLGRSAALHIDDLKDPSSPGRIVAAAQRAFGRIDGLVNNAAWIKRSNLANTTPEVFDGVMAVNARAPLLLIQAAMPHLIATRGAVLNIGSINAYCGEANQLAYSMSKAALMTLTRNLADAHGRQQVRFNQLNLGWVLTPNEYELKKTEGLKDDWPEHVPPAFAPSGRLLTPQAVAAAAVYWVGDESRPVSGSVLEIEQYPVIGRNPVKEG